MDKIIKTVKYLIISIIFSSVSIYSNTIYALSSEWVVNDKSKVRLVSSKTNSDFADSILISPSVYKNKCFCDWKSSPISTKSKCRFNVTTSAV